MKGVLIFTIVLAIAILGHDAWVSYEKDLPFALSDFGWMINTYIPQAEEYIIDTLSSDDQAKYIAPIFETETIFVALIVMALLLVLSFIANASENIEGFKDFKLFGKGDNDVKSLRKRDNQKSMKYKRK